MAKIYTADLVGKKESVVDEILLLDPHQTPLISLLGFSNPITQVEHTWYEDEVFPYAAIATAGGTASDTEITVSTVEPFRPNQVVKIGEELLKVTAVDGTKITVTRGYANTTATDFQENAQVEVLFVEGKEGADAREARFKKRVRKSNITQIFDDTIEITGTAEAVTQYGISDLYEYEKQKKQVELALQLEKALINGVYFDNGADIRQMRGIRQFIQTNVIDASGQDISLDLIGDLGQAVYEKGGFASGGDYYLLCGARQKRKISKLSDTQITLDRNDRIRGFVVDTLETDFGVFPVLLDNNLAPDEVILIDANRVAIKPLDGRAFFHKYLGDKGDYRTGILVGEYTLEFRQEKAHARLRNLKVD